MNIPNPRTNECYFESDPKDLRAMVGGLSGVITCGACSQTCFTAANIDGAYNNKGVYVALPEVSRLAVMCNSSNPNVISAILPITVESEISAIDKLAGTTPRMGRATHWSFIRPLPQ